MFGFLFTYLCCIDYVNIRFTGLGICGLLAVGVASFGCGCGWFVCLFSACFELTIVVGLLYD